MKSNMRSSTCIGWDHNGSAGEADDAGLPVRRCPWPWGATVIITRILAVYRSCPVMIVAETEEGVLLELSLKELADVYEFLPPMLWQALVDKYNVFQVA
jgi:hypothetical protein